MEAEIRAGTPGLCSAPAPGSVLGWRGCSPAHTAALSISQRAAAAAEPRHADISQQREVWLNANRFSGRSKTIILHVTRMSFVPCAKLLPRTGTPEFFKAGS